MIFFIFLLGLAAGSFLNCVVYRLKKGYSLKGRSFCPQCRKKLFWYDNLPLVSFLFLRGKCRFCRSPIPYRYPVGEFLTGLAWAATYYFTFLQFPGNYLLLVYRLLLVSLFMGIAFFDALYGLIPDVLIYLGLVLALGAGFVFKTLFLNLISGLGAAFLFALLVWLTKGRGMGEGDVKLVGLMGLFLGWPRILVALYAAFLTGGAVGVILILWGKKKFGQTLAFGPYLVSGTFLALFWGETIWSKLNQILFL